MTDYLTTIGELKSDGYWLRVCKLFGWDPKGQYRDEQEVEMTAQQANWCGLR